MGRRGSVAALPLRCPLSLIGNPMGTWGIARGAAARSAAGAPCPQHQKRSGLLRGEADAAPRSGTARVASVIPAVPNRRRGCGCGGGRGAGLGRPGWLGPALGAVSRRGAGATRPRSVPAGSRLLHLLPLVNPLRLLRVLVGRRERPALHGAAGGRRGLQLLHQGQEGQALRHPARLLLHQGGHRAQPAEDLLTGQGNGPGRGKGSPAGRDAGAPPSSRWSCRDLGSAVACSASPTWLGIAGRSALRGRRSTDFYTEASSKGRDGMERARP